ncbi:MAG: HPr family phosphocarrier protein [Deltaproteobacteria bacterium]|nr:HPr family phosphocarrier protein [Deltaproteobacteria bacterium]
MTAKADYTIVNALGLHARAAAQLVKLANRFHCDVFIVKEGQEVNGKSIMGVLMLAATQGSVITVRTEGSDAEPALKALGELVQAGFGEGS